MATNLGEQAMTLLIIAVGPIALTKIEVTVSPHPAAARHGSRPAAPAPDGGC
jgi:hypothetical protein